MTTSRQRWSAASIALVEKGADYPEFHALFPDFSFDAWEVKRRRVRKPAEAENPNVGPALVSRPFGVYVGPTIVYWDIECTYSSQPRLLTCSFADVVGNVKTFDLETHPGPGGWLDDSRLAMAIRDELEQYTILAGWNSKLFDIPVVNGRLAYHGLRPVRPQMHIDLMYYATGGFQRIGRKSLESVSKFYNVANSKTPLSPHLWDLADHGDMAAYQLIREHNIADVLVTRDVFAHLEPFIRTIHRGG